MGQPPVQSLRARSRDEVAAMGIVAQANVLQLQTAANRRLSVPQTTVPSPGAVGRYREALIDWRTIREYSESELLLRTHQVWGQYCVFCWAFDGQDPQKPPPFAGPRADLPMRSPCQIGGKLLEIERGLWRLRFEDRLRHEPELRGTPDFRKEYEAAMDIPMLVFGQNVRTCSDADLLAGTCQYAGMLAAIRWIADHRWNWGQEGIMELEIEPTSRWKSTE
jgi:hypothetical protein